MALGDDHIIPLVISDGLDSVDHLGEKIVGDFAADDPDGAATLLFQALGDRVRAVVEVFLALYSNAPRISRVSALIS